MSNVYTVSNIYRTIIGEGARAGSKAIVVKLSGCNLWDGLPENRMQGKGACALWCDASFAKGESCTADQIVANAERMWAADLAPTEPRWVLLTGGEPLLQLDLELVDALQKAGFKVAVETNGTIDPLIPGSSITPGPEGSPPERLLNRVDWVTVTPKLGTSTKVQEGDEMRVVLPGSLPPDPGWTDQALDVLGAMRFKHFYVVPQDPIDHRQVEHSFLTALGQHKDLAGLYQLHVQRAASYVDQHPKWRLSLQMNKLIGLQ